LSPGEDSRNIIVLIETIRGLYRDAQPQPGSAQSLNLPNDPWGKPYVYRSPAERSAYEIVSYGAHGQDGGTGTAADISTASSD
jgi:type II secretory pathway pseudopilin PulG